MKPKTTKQLQAEIDLMRVMYAYRQPINRRRHITTGAVATMATIVSVLVLIASAYVLTR